MNEAFTYKWTRLSTGEFYIGVHKGAVDDGYTGSGKLFRSKFDNTSRQDWKREIMNSGTLDEMYEFEKKTVNHETISNPLCLNLKVGGIGGCGPMPETLKEKIRDANLGRIKSEEEIQKIRDANLGRKHSDKTKEKMRGPRNEAFVEMRRRIQTGKKLSEETKQKQSQSRKEWLSKNVFSHSAETKKRLSEATRLNLSGTKWYVFEDGTKIQTKDMTEEKFRSGMKFQKGMKWN